MTKFKPYNVDQLMLLPASIHDYVSDDSLARLVDKVVEHLETRDIESQYSELGQNTYHPKILIKILFYGYATGERSGRKLAKRCETDTAYMYLAQMHKPNFRTINDFRKNNLKNISYYFVDIVRLCKELGIIKIGQINIDGTKIKANAANRRTKSEESYKKWLEGIEEKIEDILKEADKTDREEDLVYGDKRGDELPEEINTEEKLKKKIEEVIKKFKKEKEKINLTDTDARFMKNGNGCIDVGYNCQIAVSEEQIIVSSEVITEANDQNALELMVKTSDKNLEEKTKEIAADTGYASYENYKYLSKNDRCEYIPDQEMRRTENNKENTYHYDNFKYDKNKDEYICPDGHRLQKYKIRRQDTKYRKWRKVIYKGKECLTCSNKILCTKQKYRTIARDDRRELLEEMRKRLQTEEGRKKYMKRLYTTEPVFGHLKFNLGYRQFLLRTIEKVITTNRIII